jgi:hypothetical protein
MGQKKFTKKSDKISHFNEGPFAGLKEWKPKKPKKPKKIKKLKTGNHYDLIKQDDIVTTMVVVDSESTFNFNDWQMMVIHGIPLPKPIGAEYEEEIESGRIMPPTKGATNNERIIRASEVLIDWQKQHKSNGPIEVYKVIELMAAFASIEVRQTLKHEDKERGTADANARTSFLARMEALASTIETEGRLFRDDEL